MPCPETTGRKDAIFKKSGGDQEFNLVSCICADTVLTLHHAPIADPDDRIRTCDFYSDKAVPFRWASSGDRTDISVENTLVEITLIVNTFSTAFLNAPTIKGGGVTLASGALSAVPPVYAEPPFLLFCVRRLQRQQ
jgi:hypothetical protein